MAKTALLFPGQGAQHIGMGKDLCDAYPRARDVFARADELLGFELTRVCFEGPESELNRTDVSQPAILVHSWAVVEVLKTTDRGRELLARGQVAAGLSLGEYSALAAAGALGWEDACRLVRKRGQYMQQACDLKPSTMASIVGLDDEALEAAIAPARDKGVVVLANFNAPGQVAISGETAAVQDAMALAKAAGAKLTVPLAVAGAFHSPLMEPARERLAAEIETTTFNSPNTGVIANVDATEHRDPAIMKANLVQQLTAPVLWAKSMQKLVEQGYDEFIELGPGTVLAGLLKRVAKTATRTSIGKATEVAAATA
ncbi:MAG: ACP S-malonyltransferase [Planctomycetes bacterium]|nr:ACP S-malonyltransferase [Planctomycetota bacterium]MCW8134129.1 ACP S-malonyltransferase [Planctomycetota bacterium]